MDLGLATFRPIHGSQKLSQTQRGRQFTPALAHVGTAQLDPSSARLPRGEVECSAATAAQIAAEGAIEAAAVNARGQIEAARIKARAAVIVAICGLGKKLTLPAIAVVALAFLGWCTEFDLASRNLAAGITPDTGRVSEYHEDDTQIDALVTMLVAALNGGDPAVLRRLFVPRAEVLVLVAADAGIFPRARSLDRFVSAWAAGMGRHYYTLASDIEIARDEMANIQPAVVVLRVEGRSRNGRLYCVDETEKRAEFERISGTLRIASLRSTRVLHHHCD